MNYIIIILIFSMGFFFVWINIYLKKIQKNLQNNFKSISFDIIHQNNQSFIQLAKGNFDSVKESMEKLNQYTKEIEKNRNESYGALNNQIERLIESDNVLRQETANLAKSLKSPNIRGAWGQIHLRRVVELAGLLNNCDFYEQKSQLNEDKIYRPDLVIRLPGEKQIVIDAKTPIDAFIESQEKEEQVKIQKLKIHALNLKKHVNDLASKKYFTSFDFIPEFVILFLPAEAFLSSAIKIEPNILEMAASKNIIIATPTTLIAILKTIANIWKEDQISKEAKEIALIGKELYSRLMLMNKYFSKLGKNLSLSVDAYNQAISSLNTRVLVSAKKLKEIGLNYEDEQLKELSKTCNVNSLENL